MTTYNYSLHLLPTSLRDMLHSTKTKDSLRETSTREPRKFQVLVSYDDVYTLKIEIIGFVAINRIGRLKSQTAHFLANVNSLSLYVHLSSVRLFVCPGNLSN